MAEVAPQIKEYMKSKGILPNNDKVKENMRANAQRIALGADEEEADEKIEDYVDVKVRQMKNEFIKEIIDCGFEKEDVEYLVEKRGVHSMEKFILIEELNSIKL